MKIKISLILCVVGLLFSVCTSPDSDVVYGPENPDPHKANWDVAVLEKVSPVSEYPTNEVTIIGSGFDTRSVDYNFAWFKLARAKVLNVWPDSIRVQVPMPNPLNPDYFFADSIQVKVALQNSNNWSNTVPFVFKPMAHQYVANIYPPAHPEDKFSKPRGIEFDNYGNIYLMNNRLRSIYKDNPEGGERTVYAFGGKFDGGLKFGPDGYLFAAGNGDNIIYRIPPGGNSYETWVTVPNPWGMDFDESGNLFVVDNKQGHLYKVTASAVVQKIAEFAGTGEKAYCRVYNGNVYVNNKISGNFFRIPVTADGLVSPADTVQGVPGTTVYDLTFAEDGSMYVTGATVGVSSIFHVTASGEVNEIVQLKGELGFMTWNDKFIYVSALQAGPVYKVMIYDNSSAPYHGRE